MDYTLFRDFPLSVRVASIAYQNETQRCHCHDLLRTRHLVSAWHWFMHAIRVRRFETAKIVFLRRKYL